MPEFKGEYADYVRDRIEAIRAEKDKTLAKCKACKAEYFKAIANVAAADYDLDIAAEEAKLVYTSALEMLVPELAKQFEQIHSLSGTSLKRDIASWHSHIKVRGRDAIEAGKALIDRRGIEVAISIYEPSGDKDHPATVLDARGGGMSVDEFLCCAALPTAELFKCCQTVIESIQDLKYMSDTDKAKLAALVHDGKDSTAEPKFYT